MVSSCCAINCKNRQDRGSGITFHRFPQRNAELRKKWIHMLRKKDFSPTHHFVCSAHFTPDSFLANYANRRQLKDDAVPTIFDFPGSSTIIGVGMDYTTEQKIDFTVQENSLNHPETKSDLCHITTKSETEEKNHYTEQEREVFDLVKSISKINKTLGQAKWNWFGENTNDFNGQQTTVQQLLSANQMGQPLEMVNMECKIEDTEEEINHKFVPVVNLHLEQVKMDYKTQETFGLIKNENNKNYNTVNQRTKSKTFIKNESNSETTTYSNESNCKSDICLVKQIDLPLVNLKMVSNTEDINFTPQEGSTYDQNNLIEQVHGVIEQTFQCSKCNLQTNLKRKLTSHLQIKHPESEKNNSKINQKCDSVSVSKNILTCTKCTYKTTMKIHLKRHLENHHGNQSMEQNYTNQLGKVSEFYKFNCVECDYKTNHSYSFKLHTMKHSGEFKFSCVDCDYKTNHSSHFKVHNKNHSGEYEYICTQCDYKSNKRSNFKLHTKIHSGVQQI